MESIGLTLTDDDGFVLAQINLDREEVVEKVAYKLQGIAKRLERTNTSIYHVARLRTPYEEKP
ncbi:MAG: hypothetical protein KJO36_09895 [Acidimicrobiia bacterium]|nr:hypothetical protein [Acidimicrobiia bacterium]